MGSLSVTLIDVGWGDSILVEHVDDQDKRHFGLVDCNDKAEEKSSFIFLRHFFERRHIDWENEPRLFDWVLLSHVHMDHGRGLKYIFRKFGAKRFWYPQSHNWKVFPKLLSYAGRSNKVQYHQSIDSTKTLPDWGEVKREILWPERHNIHPKNEENNNSVVMVLRLGQVAFVLTGDAEEKVWEQMADKIPADTKFFKVPHHGSKNGTFGTGNSTPWYDACPDQAALGISAHLRPKNYAHPHKPVIDLFDDDDREYYRTDHHYHVTFRTNGTDLKVKYSRY